MKEKLFNTENKRDRTCLPATLAQRCLAYLFNIDCLFKDVNIPPDKISQRGRGILWTGALSLLRREKA